MSDALTPKLCKNCGELLTMAFCPQCGQSVKVEVPTVQTFLHDAFAALFSYDAKAWRTLGRLLVKPGQLTVDYVEGRRISLVAPVTLYFWLQTICFLTFAFFLHDMAGQATDRARSLLIMTGVLAVILAIITFYRKRKFAEHFVFSLHLSSFLLLVLTFDYALVPVITTFLQKTGHVSLFYDPGRLMTKVAIVFMMPYTVFALRRFYGDHFILAIVNSVTLYYSYFMIYVFISRWFNLK